MQRVFITGASSGIGAALAQCYAEQGAVLGLVARCGDALQRLAASLPNASRHRIYPLDVTDHAALTEAAADFIAAMDGVDVVIANAGISHGTLTEQRKTCRCSNGSSPPISWRQWQASRHSSPR